MRAIHDGPLRLKPTPVDAMRVPRRRRLALYLTMLVLTLSGVAWLVVHWQRAATELPSPLEPVTMRIHGAAAMAALFLFGTLFHTHMLRGWRARHNRKTGLVIGSASAFLVASGWGLYYLEGDVWRTAADLSHCVIGVALPLLLWLHIARGRRLAERSRRHR